MNLFSISAPRSSASKNVCLSSLVVLVSIFGDLLTNRSTKFHKALFDNATHAIVGGLSWLIVCINQKNKNSQGAILQVALCTLISSFIDLDHFIVARSFSLKNATNLQRRPFLHCSSIPIILTTYLLLISYYLNDHTLQKTALIIFTAFFTHHTRDAARWGYWIYPFGHTAPIPYVMYIGVTVLIPHLVNGIMKCMNLTTSVQYSIVDI